ncbi:filamin-binding LIM protein 1 isoform X2 [Petaurus breviceps papuanus]|uniref:filamin-binding LIM protein 1 isoform X2 n=1 Tax=Petaurus breviceps papuanus TaxID=3040969 RepID=UPI0036DE387E
MMAAKPEKRMASSIFITLTPPRRDTAVVDEVRQAACSSRVSRAREPALAKKPPGDFLVGRQGPQVPSIPAAPVLLPNGGSALPRPAPDAEDSFPDLDLLPPPPPPPAFLLPPEEEGLTQGGDSLSEDLQQLHVVPPPPPPQALPEPHQLKLRPNHLKGVEEELPPPPEEPDRVPGREESTDICAFCHKVVSPQELAVEAMKRQYHAQCFTCRACHRQLAGQCFYQKDGRPLCESCYQGQPPVGSSFFRCGPLPPGHSREMWPVPDGGPRSCHPSSGPDLPPRLLHLCGVLSAHWGRELCLG